MLKNLGLFFHLWICICVFVSLWLYPGYVCVCVICSLSVSYQQAYGSYPIICIKMHKTYKCGLTNNIAQVTTCLFFRLRMLCGFMPVIVLATTISGPILCYALGVPHWPSFHNATLHGAKSCWAYKAWYLMLECSHFKIAYPNGLELISRVCMSLFDRPCLPDGGLCSYTPRH